MTKKELAKLFDDRAKYWEIRGNRLKTPIMREYNKKCLIKANTYQSCARLIELSEEENNPTFERFVHSTRKFLLDN